MRPLIYGNGSLLVCIDERGIVRDFYYPYMGMENHGAYMRLGLYDIDTKRFGWFDEWEVTQKYMDKLPGNDCRPGEDRIISYDNTSLSWVSLIGESVFQSHSMGVTATVHEMVHQNRDIFLRTIGVKNISGIPKSFRLFSSQSYHILENSYANTAVRDGPMMNHYKRDRFFLHSSEPVFDQFTTGISEWGDKLGTWKDAEDGVLEGNIVSHGTVDSTVGWTLPRLDTGQCASVHFWVCVGRDFMNAKKAHDWMKAQDIGTIYHTNRKYWRSFCIKALTMRALGSINKLPREIQDTFTRSILAMACHIDRGGSIIASCDSQIKQQGADYYTYCWPRDAAWVTIALDKAGYGSLSRNTYDFFKRIIDPKGCFRHKYTPAGDLGSTWHPLPMIQIDETAMPLYAIYRHWLENKDIMTISGLYEPLIKPAADFLISFLDPETGLARPSFDLWEERKGVYTYSCSTVYAGLNSAAEIALLLGDDRRAITWRDAAASVKNAVIEKLYDEDLGRFKRGIDDNTVDASLFAVWYLGIVPPTDTRAVNTMNAIKSYLTRPNGGIARYNGDMYQGYMNSWPLCTLWLAQWYIKIGQLDRAFSIIERTARQAVPSGLMPEQVGNGGEPISVLPLAWSHSTFVLTVIEYLEALTGHRKQ